MAQKIQVRRGSANNRITKIFDSGEPVWDTDNRRLFIGDGITTGGIDIAPPITSFKNKLINGNFEIAQRGTSFSTLGTYGIDRWITNGAGDSYVCTQLGTALGITYTTSRYVATWSVTSVAGTGNFIAAQQRVENVRVLANKTVTVSFVAWASVAGKKIGLSMQQNFGSGGSPSASYAGNGQAITLTTTPTRYSLTFAVPSITGLTLGTNNNDYTEVVFWLDAGNTFDVRTGTIGQLSATVALADVQLEVGSVATDFEQRPTGLELTLCQRYFCKSFAQNVAPTTGTTSVDGLTTHLACYVNANQIRSGDIAYPVTMRTVPTMTAYSTTNSPSQGTGIWAWYNGTAYVNTSAVGFGTSQNGFSVSLSTVATVTALGAYTAQGQWTADAEL